MTSTGTANRPNGLRVLAAIVIAEIALIAGAIGWVAIYSYLIAPDQPIAAYHAHAQASGPWVSLVLGAPVFFGLGRWLARQRPLAARANAVTLSAGYAVIDLALVLILATTAIPWGMVAASYTTKFAAAWFGATTTSGGAGRSQ